MKIKSTAAEPAERAFTVALSAAELIAVIKWHSTQAARIPKALGQASLELQAASPLPSGRRLRELHDIAKEQLTAHATRARELMALLPK